MDILCHIHDLSENKNRGSLIISHSNARPAKIAWNGKLYQTESGNNAVPCKHVDQTRTEIGWERERERERRWLWEQKLIFLLIILCLLYGPMGSRKWYKAQKGGLDQCGVCNRIIAKTGWRSDFLIIVNIRSSMEHCVYRWNWIRGDRQSVVPLASLSDAFSVSSCGLLGYTLISDIMVLMQSTYSGSIWTTDTRRHVCTPSGTSYTSSADSVLRTNRGDSSEPLRSQRGTAFMHKSLHSLLSKFRVLDQIMAQSRIKWRTITQCDTSAGSISRLEIVEHIIHVPRAASAYSKLQ